MNLKNIIIFYPSMERGGVTVNLEHFINYFTNNNIKVSLVSNKFDSKKLSLKKEKFFFYKTKFNFKFKILPDRWLTSFLAINNLVKSFFKYNKKNTVILSMQSSMVAIIVCKLFGYKVVVRNQEDPLSSTKYANNYFLSIIIFVLRFFIYNFANGILTNSFGSKKSLEVFILNNNKVKAIYNPYLLKINKKNKKNKKNIILSAGRLCKQKDFCTLILGFSKFVKKFPKYKLIILGDGPDKNKLYKLINDLGLSKNVIIKGWVKNTKKYFLSAKIFALTSLYEGLGNVFIDAVNYEIPCIYANCKSGPNEILLNKKGGLQVKIGDYNELSNKLEESITNYKKSKKMIKFAKTKINRFCYKTTCPKYLSYLEEICSS